MFQQAQAQILAAAVQYSASQQNSTTGASISASAATPITQLPLSQPIQIAPVRHSHPCTSVYLFDLDTRYFSTASFQRNVIFTVLNFFSILIINPTRMAKSWNTVKCCIVIARFHLFSNLNIYSLKVFQGQNKTAFVNIYLI